MDRPENSSAPLSRARKLLALAIAAASDAVSAFTAFAPPLEIAVDLATAFALFIVLGFRWAFVPVLFMEAIPVLAALPAWTVVVAGLIALERPRK